MLFSSLLLLTMNGCVSGPHPSPSTFHQRLLSKRGSHAMAHTTWYQGGCNNRAQMGFPITPVVRHERQSHQSTVWTTASNPTRAARTDLAKGLAPSVTCGELESRQKHAGGFLWPIPAHPPLHRANGLALPPAAPPSRAIRHIRRRIKCWVPRTRP